ncbi:hypothetical protein Y032_0272g962 [Ancylostoma ceylanicum]|uniref:Uncharacterized protein n=1 Tax=Ancylostoma ceylanicum TaxID=53326 RepID=A0A016S9E7_9BILA|nr:hypothetical protein Y032_0272g962 [Ancylostoma ceylanicum]
MSKYSYQIHIGKVNNKHTFRLWWKEREIKDVWSEFLPDFDPSADGRFWPILAWHSSAHPARTAGWIPRIAMDFGPLGPESS